MTAPDTLLALIEVGASLWADGRRLRYRAPVGAIDDGLRARAAAARGALLALVRAGATLPVDRAAWPSAAREAFEERAGFLEFDAGHPRVAAEREAERLVRVDHARAFITRSALVVNPEAGAVATTRPGSDPHRRP